jgi:5-methylcytosine-specific restriction endonuclease McrA
MKETIKECKNCGKEMILANWEKDRKFCCADCYHKFSKGKRKTAIKRECIECGKEFYFYDCPSNRKVGRVGKYCSIKCCAKSEEYRKNISIAGKGKKRTAETKQRMREAQLGKKHTEETKKKLREASKKRREKYGYILSPEARKKISIRNLTRGIKPPIIKGEKNHMWRGGITPLNHNIRNCFKYRQWRDDVFTRDDWTCQECGARCGNGKKVILNAHHIENFSDIMARNKIETYEQAIECEELWNINNGITFCENCHNKKERPTNKGQFQKGQTPWNKK